MSPKAASDRSRAYSVSFNYRQFESISMHGFQLYIQKVS